MSMLTDGFSWLADQLNTHAGTEAVLHRGVFSATIDLVSQGGGDGQYLARLADTPDETVYAMMPGYSTFHVKIEDYTVNGVAVEPAVGDRLVIGDKEFWLTVPEGGKSPFEYSPTDDNAIWYKLHTMVKG